MNARLKAGVHDLPAEQYHADPCVKPSLSASIASLMCSRSPRHAWAAHPRLNPAYERPDEQKFAVGTVAHALLLKGETVCHVVDAKDWRTNAAKEVRDKALENGMIPLLAHHWDEVQAMVNAVRPQLEAYEADPPLLCDGQPEQTLIWKDKHGVTCRAMMDWLRDDRTAIDDLKTTKGSAHPRDWTRRMFDIGADIQVAFYMRGVRTLFPDVEPEFRFVVVECEPPYAVSVVSLAPSALALANAKVEWAIDKWAECTKTGAWPAYVSRVSHISAPAWEEARWLEERELEAEVAA